MLVSTKKYGMIWLLVFSLVLVACERPFQASDDVPTGPGAGEVTDPGGGETTTDPGTTDGGSEATNEGGEATGGEETINEGGEATGGEETTNEGGEATGGEETTNEGGEATGGEETTNEGGEATGGEETTNEGGEATGGEETTNEGGEATGGEETTNEGGEATGGEETTNEGGEATGGTAEQPANTGTHVVVAGDSLYKIGLKYGVSWVTLAELNGLDNPNRLSVGQEIKLPSESEALEPTPSPQTEEIYVVNAGDNLYRIGLAYGLGWVQIAEANGIVNPNHLVVGQKIKIPMEATGPIPQFSHKVRNGDTLFRISLQYGVTWSAIAEANNLESPYVIFPGQELVIPGG